MTTLHIITPIVMRPRREMGVDWGKDRFVLARHGEREVWYEPGSFYWSSVGAPFAYASAKLTLRDMNEDYPYAYRDLPLNRGRLSFRALNEHADAIDRWLRTEVSAAGRIDPKRRWTVEVKP